jgi:TrmH RNA methyltransferase
MTKKNSKKSNNKEFKVYGLNACIAYAKKRPSDVLRAYYKKEHIKHFVELQKNLAATKKVFRIVDEDELEKLSQSKHHEGVCFVVNASPIFSIENWLRSENKKTKSVLLVLENIGNPHNIGAILRIAAHFGIVAVASQDPKSLSSGAAMRTAEGGAEYIKVVGYSQLKVALQVLKKSGYKVLSTSSHKGESLYKFNFPDKVVLLFGEEGGGLTKDAFSMEDHRIAIPGTGNVESLNVSTAIAIVGGELWRQTKES